jgi:hypothetical protein
MEINVLPMGGIKAKVINDDSEACEVVEVKPPPKKKETIPCSRFEKSHLCSLS